MSAIESKLVIYPFEGRIDRVFKNGTVRKSVGSKHSKGYLQINISNSPTVVHRIIYSHFHGPIPPWLEIDHINGIKTDNRIENLRLVTVAGNQQNRRVPGLSNTSGLLGAHFHKPTGKWKSEIDVDGVRKYIGLFESKNEAHAAYLNAKRELHSTCTI